MTSFLDDLGSDEEGEVESESEPAAQPVPKAKPAEPGEAAAKPAEPAATPTPPTQEAQPQPGATPPATPTPEPQAQPELTPEQVHERFRQWREQGVDLLAREHFHIAPEQVKEIVDPETGMVNGEKLAKTISRVASQVYMDVVTAAMGQMTQHMPALIDRVIQARGQAQQIENEFFTQWPQLKEHRNVVLRLGQVFRQQNPRASKDAFIKEVGASAMVALRLGVPAAAPPAAAPAPARPFRPAATARPTTPPPTQRPMNAFEALAAADTEDDRTVEEID